jgi:hypothetical protein
MSRLEQHETAQVAEQAETNALTLHDAMHLQESDFVGGFVLSQCKLPGEMNSNRDLLAQLDVPTPDRALSGLPMTRGGEPAQPRTREDADRSIESALKYWRGLV